MRRFRFRLKPLLALREAHRDLRREQLAESLAVERSLAARKAELERELGRQRHLSRSDARPGQIDLERLQAADRYERTLQNEMLWLVQSEQALGAEIEKRQQAAAAADGEVRVLEKLRERQLAEFRRTGAQDEIKELDEAAVRGPARQSAD